MKIEKILKLLNIHQNITKNLKMKLTIKEQKLQMLIQFMIENNLKPKDLELKHIKLNPKGKKKIKVLSHHIEYPKMIILDLQKQK